MVVTQNKLKTRIAEDKDFFSKLEKGTKQQLTKLQSSWVSREDALKQIRSRLTKTLGTGGLKIISSLWFIGRLTKSNHGE